MSNSSVTLLAKDRYVYNSMVEIDGDISVRVETSVPSNLYHTDFVSRLMDVLIS